MIILKRLLVLFSFLDATAHAAGFIDQLTTNVMTLQRQSSAPVSPASGYVKEYVLDSDGKFYIKNSAGTAKACTYSGDIVNADVASGAAIAYSKLSLASSVVNADLATMAQSTIKGRAAGAGTGAPTDLTATQSQAIVGSVPQVLTQQSTPASPSAGSNALYFKSDDKLYKLNSSGTEAEVGSGGAGANTSKNITQSAHGFVVGDWLYLNSSTYTKADADAASTAEVVGVVSAVADTDNFTMVSVGYVTGLSGLTAGTTYFLSATAGAMTATEPSTNGQVSKPVFVADSTTSGYAIQSRGVVIGGTASNCAAFTPAMTSFGAISAASGYYCVSGKAVTMWWVFTSDSPAAATASMTLPNSYDQAFAVTLRIGGCTQDVGITGNIHVLGGSGTAITFGYETGSTAGLSSVNANGIISDGVKMTCNATVYVE